MVRPRRRKPLEAPWSRRGARALLARGTEGPDRALFRWFVGLSMDEAVWHVTVYTKNRDRLLQADVAKRFFELVVAEAQRLNLMSDEHFTVDGTLLEACASLKSFKKVDAGEEPPVDDPGNPTVDFHGEKRSNQTHASATDADAMLARKGSGKEAKLSYSGHV